MRRHGNSCSPSRLECPVAGRSQSCMIEIGDARAASQSDLYRSPLRAHEHVEDHHPLLAHFSGLFRIVRLGMREVAGGDIRAVCAGRAIGSEVRMGPDCGLCSMRRPWSGMARGLGTVIRYRLRVPQVRGLSVSGGRSRRRRCFGPVLGHWLRRGWLIGIGRRRGRGELRPGRFRIGLGALRLCRGGIRLRNGGDETDIDGGTLGRSGGC